MSGSMDIVIAAGVESMTRVPMGLASSLPAKNGFGHYKSPGIEKRYPNILFSQFTGAEMMAEKYGLSKDELDEYSYNSHQRAIAATQAGRFKDEIVPVQITRADGSSDTHNIDEGIRFDVSLEGIKGVKLIAENGKLTAASDSQICDGVAENHRRRSRAAQRQWRRDRARSPAWLLRHQADDDAGQCAQAAQQALRPADHVRRRRHGQRDDCGKAVDEVNSE